MDSRNIKTVDMTDEISGKGITNFISTGPKSYSFKYGDNKQKSAIKVSHLTMKTTTS